MLGEPQMLTYTEENGLQEKTPLRLDMPRQVYGDSAVDRKPMNQDVEAVEEEREGWDNKVQFLLSVIAYAVGKPKGQTSFSVFRLLVHIASRSRKRLAISVPVSEKWWR